MKRSVELLIKTLIKDAGDDPAREGLAKTPERFCEMWAELLSGYKQDPVKLIKGSMYSSKLEDMVVVSGITFYSTCEHHMVPFFGKAHVAYIPRGRIVGISKIARLIDVFAKRLQVQESMTHDIATTLMKVLKPQGAAVVIEARHLCMEMRGVKKEGAAIKTSAMLGVFRRSAATRSEFLSLIEG